MKVKTIALFLLTVIWLAGCASLPGASTDTALQASGLIEATEISLSPEMSGRILEVNFFDGDAVQAGDVVLRLDDTLLRSQRAAAEAGLNTAQKGLQAAQVALEITQLQYDTALSDALAAAQPQRIAAWDQSRPSEFDLPMWYFAENERILATQTALEDARAALEAAQSNLQNIEAKAGSAQFLEAEKQLSETRIAFQLAEDLLDKANGGSDTQKLRDQAQEIYDDARTDLDDAQRKYDDAITSEGADDVLAARAKAAVAQERFDLAQDALRALQTGAQAPDVLAAAKSVEQSQAALEQAQAVLDQAQAELDLIDVQIEKLVLYAPVDGTVLACSVQPGEVLQAGMTALTLGKLDILKVTVYISENRYGQVHLGDQVDLSLDSFPGKTFQAAVTRIADQAEFTPRNVQTKEERQTTVYAVELSIDNPDGDLKPGMPVDVTFP